MEWLGVAIGGAAGSLARYGVTLAMARALGSAFPWGTILINILGSALIGWFASATLPSAPMEEFKHLRVLVMTGFCGGFTTFSAFSLQTLGLLQEGDMLGALANVALSVLLCVGAVALGWMAGERGWLFN